MKVLSLINCLHNKWPDGNSIFGVFLAINCVVKVHSFHLFRHCSQNIMLQLYLLQKQVYQYLLSHPNLISNCDRLYHHFHYTMLWHHLMNCWKVQMVLSSAPRHKKANSVLIYSNCMSCEYALYSITNTTLAVLTILAVLNECWTMMMCKIKLKFITKGYCAADSLTPQELCPCNVRHPTFNKLVSENHKHAAHTSRTYHNLIES